MSNIDDMFSGFKEYADLKKFAEAQYKTIIDLSKKQQEAEKEIKHLKKLLEGAVPVLSADAGPKGVVFSTDEETICVNQLELLRDISTARELTFEESKKVDLFAKLLKTIRETPKKLIDESEPLDKKDTSELLTLIKNE